MKLEIQKGDGQDGEIYFANGHVLLQIFWSD